VEVMDENIESPPLELILESVPPNPPAPIVTE
jgi:hypothetical protein